MDAEHGDLERLAVAHALGDLTDADAARFRMHLLRCHDCRSRVAEFRAIAAELEDVEREELARSESGGFAPAGGRPSGTPRAHELTLQRVTLAAMVVLLLAVAMGSWNLVVRSTTVAHRAVAVQRGEALQTLATGTFLEVSLAEGLQGFAVVDGDRVAVFVSGLEQHAADEVVVAWFLDAPGGPTPIALSGPGQLADGMLVATLEDRGASALVITREQEPGELPSGPELFRASLPGADRPVAP